MAKAKRVQYTPEFRQEAVRLVESGESIAAAARSLGVVEQTLDNWVRAHRAGTLKGAGNKPSVSTEQMENSRLRAELARVRMERDILPPHRYRPIGRDPGLGKAVAYFAKGQK
jgi:transposase